VPGTTKENRVASLRSELLSWIFREYETQTPSCPLLLSVRQCDVPACAAVRVRCPTLILRLGRRTACFSPEDGSLLDCRAVYSGTSLPTVQKSLLPPLPGREMTDKSSVMLCQTARRSSPEDGSADTCHRGNLKSH
jgi:hypothetical protein